jgi:hypothetical protein
VTPVWLMPAADPRPLLELSLRDNPVRHDGIPMWPRREPHRYARFTRAQDFTTQKAAAPSGWTPGEAA